MLSKQKGRVVQYVTEHTEEARKANKLWWENSMKETPWEI
jgi:hypothetical protein